MLDAVHIYTHIARFVVCLLGTLVSEPIEMLLGAWTRVGPRIRVLDEGFRYEVPHGVMW